MSNNPHNLPFQSKLDRWLTSINSLFENIPALEVSTTIVETITPEVFIPWEVYQNIYQISPDYLNKIKIEPDLSDRYLDLRRRLELQYALLLVNPESKLYNPKLKSEIQADLPILAQPDISWHELTNRLPSPESLRDRDQKRLNQLLQDHNFLVTLRQLGKLKTFLDCQASATKQDNQIIPEITYAQTSIKIDGKIDNCYSQEILQLDLQTQRKIIEFHSKGILSGEKQWHQLIKFILKAFDIKH